MHLLKDSDSSVFDMKDETEYSALLVDIDYAFDFSLKLLLPINFNLAITMNTI